MDDITTTGLVFGVVLLVLMGLTATIAIWVIERLCKFFGGK